MFYQYNNFTGRVTGSQHFQPYFPVGVKPVANSDPPKIIFANPNVTIAKESPPPRRGAGGKIFAQVPEQLRKRQMMFQQADGVLIHLKGGPVDRVLFGVTLALCGVGLMGCFKTFYDLSTPKKE